MIRRGIGHAGSGHVGIADGLDLLDAVLCGEPVEGLHDLVQELDGACGTEPARERDEAGEVGEQHGRAVDAVGDRGAGRRLQPLGDALGEDVAQQRLGLRARLLGRAEGVVDDHRRHHERGEDVGDVAQ